MRLTLRDLVASVLLLAIAVPYGIYLVNDTAPLVDDARGMAAGGLLIGAVMVLVLRSADEFDTVGKVESLVAFTSLALGVVALAFAETAAAEVLLAVFMVSILVVWAVEVLDHSGLVHWHAEVARHV